MIENLMVLPAVSLDGKEYRTYRDDRGREVMQDLDIGSAIDLGRPRNIRQVIARNLAELGDVRCYQQRTSGQDGPPTDVYYLTEEQAIFIAAKCRTKAATDLLKRLIAVYMLARQGNSVDAAAVAQGAVRHPQDLGDPLTLIIRQSEQTASLARGLLEQRAEVRRLADQHGELAKVQTMQGAKVEALVAAQQAAVLALALPHRTTVLVPPISKRLETNQIIRAYAMATGQFRETWNILWTTAKYRLHKDIKQCAKNAKITPSEMADQLGLWDQLHALAVELFTSQGRLPAGQSAS